MQWFLTYSSVVLILETMYGSFACLSGDIRNECPPRRSTFFMLFAFCLFVSVFVCAVHYFFFQVDPHK